MKKRKKHLSTSSSVTHHLENSENDLIQHIDSHLFLIGTRPSCCYEKSMAIPAKRSGAYQI